MQTDAGAEPSPSETVAARYRQAIATFATGVTVITTVSDGVPVGMTASAVASLSLDPVLLLVCVNHLSPTHEAIERAQAFVVNVLGEGQEELARHCARRNPDKFSSVRLRDGHDMPVLADAIAHFVCDVHERLPGGDHSIFIGRVRECDFVPNRRPLLYFRSRFGALDDPDADLSTLIHSW